MHDNDLADTIFDGKTYFNKKYNMKYIFEQIRNGYDTDVIVYAEFVKICLYEFCNYKRICCFQKSPESI